MRWSRNEGKLKANGGRVELTAAAARQVVDSVINNTGVIEANSVGTRNGMIVLGAATAGTKGARRAEADREGLRHALGRRQAEGHQGRHHRRHRREHPGRAAPRSTPRARPAAARC